MTHEIPAICKNVHPRKFLAIYTVMIWCIHMVCFLPPLGHHSKIHVCSYCLINHCTTVYTSQAFQSVSDKSGAAKTLLSLAGSLTDSLLQKMTNKAERLALTAHLPPSQLEWVRKQVGKTRLTRGFVVHPLYSVSVDCMYILGTHL